MIPTRYSKATREDERNPVWATLGPCTGALTSVTQRQFRQTRPSAQYASRPSRPRLEGLGAGGAAVGHWRRRCALCLWLWV